MACFQPTVKVFLLGSADFMRRGLADGFADGRAGHAVLRGGDPVRQRLSRHVTVEEEQEEEEEKEVVVAVVVMVVSGWGELGRTIKMSLVVGRRVVPSVRVRRKRRKRGRGTEAAEYTEENPVGEFMRRPKKEKRNGKDYSGQTQSGKKTTNVICIKS